jgi:predicted CoA-binding protein
MDQDTADRILGYAHRIAVVGLSPDPSRPSNDVARSLIDLGYEIVPINPNVEEVFGLKSYPDLAEVPGPIDVVDVFRRTVHCEELARSAVAAGARALWLQSGLVCGPARRVAAEGGLDYVEDRCLKVDANEIRGRN